MTELSEGSLDHLRELPLSRRAVYQGKLLRAYEDEVTLPGGGTGRRELVVHPGATAIVPIDDDGRVLLVRQWRHAIGRALWELPAGGREPGEEAQRGAQRELEEETGYTSPSWRLLGVATVAPGYSTEILHIFLAQGLRPGTSHPDEGENLEVSLFSREGVARLFEGGDLDLKTVAGLALAGWPVAIGGGDV